MKLKINFKNQLYTLGYSFYMLVGSVGILFLLKFDSSAIIIFLGGFVLTHIPAVYLHLKYFRENKGCELEINDDRLVFSNSVNRTSETLSVKDIERVDLYMAANRYDAGIYFVPHLSYYYAKFVMNDGNKEFKVTCLMSPNLFSDIKKIKGIKFNWHKTFFARI